MFSNELGHFYLTINWNQKMAKLCHDNTGKRAREQVRRIQCHCIAAVTSSTNKCHQTYSNSTNCHQMTAQAHCSHCRNKEGNFSTLIAYPPLPLCRLFLVFPFSPNPDLSVWWVRHQSKTQKGCKTCFQPEKNTITHILTRLFRNYPLYNFFHTVPRRFTSTNFNKQ